MTPLVAGLVPALWLGILTSISPCPLASNLAAVSYLGRQARSPGRVLLAGLAYSAGRALTYVAVGWIVVSSVLALPEVSLFLQKRMNQVLGPVLVLIGLGMLGALPLRWPSTAFGDELRGRVAGGGLFGAAGLGALFALSFCPVSAGLFFGGLIPLATSTRAGGALAAVYGVGTALPVVVFAVLISLGSSGISRAFGAVTRFERVARVVTGGVFVAAGAYLIATHVFGVEI